MPKYKPGQAARMAENVPYNGSDGTNHWLHIGDLVLIISRPASRVAIIDPGGGCRVSIATTSLKTDTIRSLFDEYREPTMGSLF